MKSMPPPGAEQRWGGYSLNAGPSPERPGGPNGLPPTSRRLMQVAGGLAVLLLAVIANYALHSEENPFNSIAKAADRTQRAAGGRAIIEVVYSSAELANPIASTGEGVYNERTGRSRFTLKVPRRGFGEMTVTAVGDDTTIYLTSAELAEQLPGGRPWMAVQPLLGRNETAVLAGNGGAKEGLEMLGAVSDDVEAVGEEAVRGVPTERYRGSVELAAFARMLSAEGKAGLAREYEAVATQIPAPVAVEVWVDHRNMIRRMRQVMTMPATGDHAEVTIDTRVDLVDLGIAPKIHLPSPHAVFDATPLARAELDLFEGSSLGPLTPPAGKRSLAATVFRRKANAICADLFHRTSGLADRAEASLDGLRQRLGQTHDVTATVGILRGYANEFIEPLLPMFDRSLRRLVELAPPPQLAADYRGFLRASVQSGEIAEAMARMFEIGELELYDKIEARSNAASDRSDAAARQLGIGKCIGEVGGDEGGASAPA
jgi:hypothetical protein